MAGELTIEQNTDGTATINFEGGGSHTVGKAGDNITDSVTALQDAYGDRIGNVISSELTGETQISNAKPVTVADTTTDTTLKNRVVDGVEIPKWVDDDYLGGYIQSVKSGKPRKPNMREMMELIAGKSVEEIYASGDDYSDIGNMASNLLYGVVGSNTDTRDFVAIAKAATDATTGELNADKFVAATQIATSQMYGGTTVAYQSGGTQTDEAGNTVSLPPSLYVVGGNGTVLTNLSTNADQMSTTLQNYGIQNTSWIDTVSPTMGNTLNNYKSAFDTLKETYNPFADYQDIFNIEGLTTSVAPKTISQTGAGTKTTQVGTDTTQVTGEAGQNTGVSNIVTPELTQQTLPQTVAYQLPQNYTGSAYLPTQQQTGVSKTVATQVPMTGTFTKPAGTGMIGYTPSTTYTVGSTPQQQQQTTATPQYDVRMYRNDAGMTVSLTFVNGQPQTPVPSGFYPVGQQPANQTPYVPQVATSPAPTVTPVTGYTPQFNMNQGGAMMPPAPPVQSASVFGGFKPESMQRIANSLGYNEDMDGFDQYLNDNPDKKQKMDNYTMKAKQMAEGGMAKSFPDLTGDGKVTQADILQGRGVELANGGMPNSTTVSLQQYDPRALNQQYIPQQPQFTGNITDVQASLAKTPALPTGATVVPVGTQLTAGQLVSPYSGQVSGSMALPTGLAATEQAYLPTMTQANMMSPIEASGAIRATADQTQAAQLDKIAQINAAQQAASSVADLKAAQGTEILMPDPQKRKIQSGEVISGVANAQTAAAFTEAVETQAATADPSKQATVAGQLEGLMQQFEGGNTPAWASGAMRAANANMIARGLGASSIAGQAIVQAAMESALPIAQMDAQVTAQFEQQNLSNRQQRAILAAQQRAQFMGQEFDQGFQARVANAAKVSDIANMNFTAEQQVALENSRIANTMELSNLSNSQAMIMAEAAALANMDMSNLNNRQQAAVQNAQNFLQADLSNLNNKQSTELFKAQQRVQSLFTDQAALNAAQQFNATSQNQVDQFYASLTNNTSQFNASQANAQAQFNAGQVNVIERFNAEINNQRDQFNAQNRLVIDQANAQWRRQIATADTATVNRANEINAQALLGYSQSAYNNLWQFYADNMEWAWTSAENERGRISAQAIAQLNAETSMSIAEFKADAESSAGIGGFIGDLLTSDLSKTVAGSLAGNFGLI